MTQDKNMLCILLKAQYIIETGKATQNEVSKDGCAHQQADTVSSQRINYKGSRDATSLMQECPVQSPARLNASWWGTLSGSRPSILQWTVLILRKVFFMLVLKLLEMLSLSFTVKGLTK